MFHLLEQIFFQFPVSLAQHQPSVWLHPLDCRHEAARGVTVGVHALAAVKRSRIKAVDVVIAAAVYKPEIRGEARKQRLQQLFPVNVAPCNLAQRHRVWRAAGEHALVDIDASTYYAAAYKAAAYGAF